MFFFFLFVQSVQTCDILLLSSVVFGSLRGVGELVRRMILSVLFVGRVPLLFVEIDGLLRLFPMMLAIAGSECPLLFCDLFRPVWILVVLLA